MDPKFLAYKAEDHARALEDPYIRDFVAYVEVEQHRGSIAALVELRARRFDEAYFKLAKADALGELIDVFRRENEPEEAPETEPDDFDPALPPSERTKDARSR